MSQEEQKSPVVRWISIISMIGIPIATCLWSVAIQSASVESNTSNIRDLMTRMREQESSSREQRIMIQNIEKNTERLLDMLKGIK